jgi:rhodanese-related sulfurtransferase
MTSEFNRCSPAELVEWLRDGSDTGFFDVREEGAFSTGHPFLARNLPLSRLEILAPRLAPRRSARIVLLDDGDGSAARAASILSANGYTSLSILDGGLPGWRRSGLPVHSGVYVASKAFGEYVDLVEGVPHIEAAQLSALMKEGADFVLFDSRPPEEVMARSVPGALVCPGPELVLRAREHAGPQTLIVVMCGGRTRSLIGAQTLIESGIPNRVVALKDGVAGWQLSGFPVVQGRAVKSNQASPASIVAARAAARRIADRFGVGTISEETLADWFEKGEERALHCFDVRPPGAYLERHRPGFLSAPGVQLLQATESYIGSRNARIVLTDTLDVQAPITAAWLIRMGYSDVHVIGSSDASMSAVAAPRHALRAHLHGAPPGIDVATLASGREDYRILDLADSRTYRAGHIPGACHCTRSSLVDEARLPKGGRPVITSPDGLLAEIIAAELVAAGMADVSVLAGGTAEWSNAGHPLEAGNGTILGDPDDIFLKAFEKATAVEQGLDAYLDWERSLPRAVLADATVSGLSWVENLRQALRQPASA